ncbi:hypothetical protein [Acuticoccus kandeliae]|uniref:hypothetical protein n=1 Tax=Acuticoccus kandeliae TaxID=2073160 RepID=UPI00147315ED|nr:hypothetical protein [Acuticoccus kandeliae]
MTPLQEGAALNGPRYLNIACGGTYVARADWENVDYTPDEAGHVTRMNVLNRLEPSRSQYEVVYCSHFVEHIPADSVMAFLERCRSLTAPGGVLRVVVPDAEFLLREHLRHKDAGNHGLAEFAFVNFLDQCVRRTRGGRLGAINGEIAQGRRPDLVEYAEFLNGAPDAGAVTTGAADGRPLAKVLRLISSPARLRAALEQRYIRLISRLLPEGFRAQNVSFADVGELHHWMYDFAQLEGLLKAAGFSSVSRLGFNTSKRSDGIFLPLDAVDGAPRKGHHQLFIEAYP